MLFGLKTFQINVKHVYKSSFHAGVFWKTALLSSVSAPWRWEARAEQRDHRPQQPPDGGKTHHWEATRRQCKSPFILSSPGNKVMHISSNYFIIYGRGFLPWSKTVHLICLWYIFLFMGLCFLIVAYLSILALERKIVIIISLICLTKVVTAKLTCS